jgi:hypothetical protein
MVGHKARPFRLERAKETGRIETLLWCSSIVETACVLRITNKCCYLE